LVLDDVIPEDEIVHHDLDVGESRDERGGHVGDRGGLTLVDCDHAARDIVGRHTARVMATPGFGVRGRKVRDLLLVVRHLL